MGIVEQLYKRVPILGAIGTGLLILGGLLWLWFNVLRVIPDVATVESKHDATKESILPDTNDQVVVSIALLSWNDLLRTQSQIVFDSLPLPCKLSIHTINGLAFKATTNEPLQVLDSVFSSITASSSLGEISIPALSAALRPSIATCLATDTLSASTLIVVGKFPMLRSRKESHLRTVGPVIFADELVGLSRHRRFKYYLITETSGDELATQFQMALNSHGIGGKLIESIQKDIR